MNLPKTISKTRKFSGFTRTNFSGRKNFGGFTIVEVLIVLAIGTLIISVVFLAVPQMQRNSRDQNRKNIASRIRGEIENYAANNEGQDPTTVDTTCLPASMDSPLSPDKWVNFYHTNIENQIDIKDPSSGTEVIGCTPGALSSQTSSYVVSVNDSAGAGSIVSPTTTAVTGVIFNSKCDSSKANKIDYSNVGNSFAIIMMLEKGSLFCTDNS